MKVIFDSSPSEFHVKFNNLPGGRVLELGIQVIMRLWTIQKIQLFHAFRLLPIFLGDWSESWLTSWFWDWQVLAVLCLVRGNPNFMLLLRLPLIVDVVSFFLQQVRDFFNLSMSFWISIISQMIPECVTACQSFFHPSFWTSDYQLETLGYHSSFLLDFRLPVGDSRLPFILPSGLQTTSWKL